MSDTWDDDDHAIARALDAAPEADTTGADEHLVDEYREVLAELPVAEVTPPAGLEDRIVAAALQRRPATVPTIATRRTRGYRRVRLLALAAATVAAAIVIGLIASDSGSPTPGGHVALTTVQRADIDALVRSPGARTGTFDPAVGKVVIAANGNAAVYALRSELPVSIGLVSRGGTTVIGPAPPSAGAIAFVVDHPERVDAVTLIRDGAEIARTELTPR